MYTIAEVTDGLRRSIEVCATFRTDLNRNRIAHALKILDAVTFRPDGGIKVTRDDQWTAMIESVDICNLHCFPIDVLRPYRKLLDRLPLGAFSYANAGSDDQGRDIAFEIGTAHWLQDAGADIKFEKPGDVMAHFNGYTLGIECKRVKKGRAIGSNLTSAAEQIEKHRSKGHQNPFVIAVDLSRAVNPDSGILLAADEEAAKRLVHLHVEKIFQENGQFIRPSIVDVQRADVDAIFFRVLAMIGDHAGKGISIATIWRVQPVVAVESDRISNLREHMSKLPGYIQGTYTIQRA